MNEIPSTGRDSLPLSGQRLLEAPCLRFEDAWKAGQTPQVEAFLGGAAGLHRAALLKELVRLDVVYRRRRGESVSSAEYLGRFPDLDATWLERELMPATLDDPRAAGLGETLSLVKPPVAANRLASAPGDSIQVPGYEVLGELGRGGMGVVYLARNVVLDRREVLKVVNQKLLGDPAVAERFLREMRAAAKLSHENVVKAHSAPQAGESLVFAMEYVEGEDLAKLVQREGPLPIPHACHYASQAAMGLQHAHEQMLVHRDIKPQNLILTRRKKKHVVKILDFGLAKAKREGEAVTDLTGQGAMMGTPAYMAPEQALDAASADIRADIYSLGCTLYFLLTGAPPFSGKSFFEILKAHESMEATPLTQLRPDAPAELAAVVAKMMAKAPAKRWQQPIDAAKALAPFIKLGTLPPPEPIQPPPLAKILTEWPPTAPAATAEAPKPREPAPAAPSVFNRPTVIGRGARPATATKKPTPRPTRPAQEKGPNKWSIAAAVGLLVLLLAVAIGLLAGGVFRVQTPEGILVVKVNEPDPDVFVDGTKVTVSWEDGGKKAEIRVPPGTRWVEVKKDGFTAYGESVELQDGKRRILTATLDRQAASAPPDKGGDQTHPKPPPVSPANARPLLLDCTGEKGVSAAAMRQAQEAWAKYLERQVEEEDEIAPGVKMKFVLIPPGTFRMGSPEGEADRGKDEVQHEVELTHPFYLGAYDVTQAQYEAVTGKTPSAFKGPDLPVETVSWEEADAFAKGLTEKARDGLLYRLPHEAEWEYSCRGGRSSSLPFGVGDGTSLSSRDANFDGNYPYGGADKGPYLQKTTPGGYYKANALGLYDMQGNVWQWCSDWYGDYPAGRAVDPTGPLSGPSRVFRGGCWYDYARVCRAAFRDGYEPGYRVINLGFRLARVPSGLDK